MKTSLFPVNAISWQNSFERRRLAESMARNNLWLRGPSSTGDRWLVSGLGGYISRPPISAPAGLTLTFSAMAVDPVFLLNGRPAGRFRRNLRLCWVTLYGTIV